MYSLHFPAEWILTLPSAISRPHLLVLVLIVRRNNVLIFDRLGDRLVVVFVISLLFVCFLLPVLLSASRGVSSANSSANSSAVITEL